MPLEAINSNKSTPRSQYKSGKQQSFTGSFNPVVTVMDAIDRGGFAASFIAQDGIGMVAPRIYEGLNRNRKKDENGKKTGPLNWEFARREGIREILSGPSAFLIPMGLLSIIKKVSGTANNVHISHINALGENFAQYASENKSQLNNAKAFKTGYYTQVFENVLSNSTDGALQGSALKNKAVDFAKKLVKIEEAKKNKDKKQVKKLQGELSEDFMKLRKSTTAASNDNYGVVMKLEQEGKLNSSLSRLTQSLTDYTDDALEKTNKFIQQNVSGDIKEFVKKFNLHRVGTRVVANLGMLGTVIGFYSLIPKLYNLGLKHDPGLNGLEIAKNQNTENKNGKDVAFTGGFAKIGETALKEGRLNKFLQNYEFNGASMPVTAMLTLLFGFTLPPRYMNAKSDKERKEILVRDISSFTAILFGAKALSRGFSNIFSKISGMALNIKPADHAKGVLYKLKNYFTAGDGINVLSSEQIVSKYSNINDYKDGINGFFTFLKENGGDVRKVLGIDKTVKAKSEAIMKKFGEGKTLENATFDEINKAFEKARLQSSEDLNEIYTVFSSKENKFVNRAKTYNSAFGFASTLILVPAFMMWLARYCERMTKRAVEKENAAKRAKQQLETAETKAQKAETQVAKPQNVAGTNQLTMAGFLNKIN